MPVQPDGRSPRQTRRALLRRLLVMGGAALVNGPVSAWNDPPNAESESRNPFEGGAAFCLPVFVQAFYVPLKQLVTQITPNDFPFALRVAPFDAETPLHLCVANQSLGDVLQTLADLLNGRWREETDADGVQKKAFVLEPKTNAIDREKALYTATLDLNAEPMMQFARAATRRGLSYWQKEYQKIQTVPSTQGEPTPEKQQLQLLASADGNGYAFCSLLAGLTRAQQRTLVGSGYLYLPWSAMNTTQRQSALASRHLTFRIALNSADDMTPEQNRAAEQKERATVQQFGLVLSVDKAPISGNIVNCRLSPGTHEGRREMRLPDVQNPFLLPVRGNPYVFNPAVSSVPNASDGEAVTPNALPASANDALLEMPSPSGVAFAKSDTWADVVQTLSGKLPFVIVSDAFTAARLCKFPPFSNLFGEVGDLSGKTIAQALDTICTAYHYLWWVEPGKNNAPGTLFFRSRAWFIEKRYEPPLTASDKAKAALVLEAKRNVSVPLVDSLTDLAVEQLQGIAARKQASPNGRAGDLLETAFMAGSGWNSACATYGWLRFWTQLTQEQKRDMISLTGLLGSTLTEAQRKVFLQNAFASSSLRVLPSEAIQRWNHVRLRLWYMESSSFEFRPENAPNWKPDELRPASLYFLAQGAELVHGSPLPLPIAITPPPQPKKKPADVNAVSKPA